MQKAFRLNHQTNFIFRAKSYNVTNTLEFAMPDTSFGDYGFGHVTGTVSVSSRQSTT